MSARKPLLIQRLRRVVALVREADDLERVRALCSVLDGISEELEERINLHQEFVGNVIAREMLTPGIAGQRMRDAMAAVQRELRRREKQRQWRDNEE